jgi:hypothetical protein
MRREVYNDGGEDDLLWILGWGNKPEYEPVRWLIDELADAGYRLTVFELPTVVTDWETEWLAPVAEYVTELGDYRLLGHSTGGLVGAFLADPAPLTRAYLSPWWGFHDDLDNPIVTIAMKLPISTPILPAGFEKSQLGELATERQVEETPSRAAPTFLREARRAQEALPAVDEEAVVFYTPADTIVGVDAIERRAPARNRIEYEGGHELFCSAVRDEYLEDLRAAIDGGIDAVATE